MQYSIGIDLGGTNMRVCLLQGQTIIAKAQAKTLPQRPVAEIIEEMVSMIRQLVVAGGKGKLRVQDLAFIGVGVPGTVDRATGTVLFATNLGWRMVPLGAQLSQQLEGTPVILDNDANCAAMGELCAGAGQGKNLTSMLMLTVGTGVGGAVVTNGQLLQGSSFGGTELGHTTLVYNGQACNCGRLGCLERYASFTALDQQAKAAAKAHPTSALATELAAGSLSGKAIFELAQQGDTAAEAVVQQFLAYLGEGVVNFINIFDPQLVVIGGGISGQGQQLTDFLTQYAASRVYSKETPLAPIVTATLGGEAGLLGAGLLGGLD